MVKRLTFQILIILQLPNFAIAQKPSIDFSSIESWPTIGPIILSPDGKYVAYIIDNDTGINNGVILKSVKGKWMKIIPNCSDIFKCKISSDSKRIVFLNNNDSMGILVLGSSEIEYRASIVSANFKGNSKFEFLVCESKNREVVLKDLKANQEMAFKQVSNYTFSDDRTLMILKSSSRLNNKELLIRYNLVNSRRDTILSQDTGIIRNIIIAHDNSKIAYTSEYREQSIIKRNIYSVANSSLLVRRLINNKEVLINQPHSVTGLIRFTNDNLGIVLNYVPINERSLKIKVKMASVDVWSYMDTKIQSVQAKQGNIRPDYVGILRIDNDSIIPITRENESISDLLTDNVLVYYKPEDIDPSEAVWHPKFMYNVYLVSLINGSRKLIAEGTKFYFVKSPGDNFVVYYNYIVKDFFSYNIVTGKTINLTHGINVDWSIYDDDQPDSYTGNNGILGWDDGDSSIIIPDQYDIWKIDLYGRQKPQNLTNGFGRRNNIAFRTFNNSNLILNFKTKIILSAYNRMNKDNGFYLLNCNADPKLLTMGQFVFYFSEYDLGFCPIKSNNGKGYIVRKETSSISPNYFYTEDFVHYSAISNVHPERLYNWLSTKLVNWTTPTSHLNQGVLYFPENFDSSRKYPIILHYYNKKSHLLNAFLHPGVSTGDINIPWFVSNGYLVFTPDIHFLPGKTGQSVVNSVVSGAKLLSDSLSFINKSKIGIQGFSFGGYHTNYLVTHSDIFAAASAGAGYCDLISVHGGINRESGVDNSQFIEFSGIGMISPVWVDPIRYISNSPIFSSSNVTTPLLLMNNKGDAAVEFSQGVEFFNALRRQNKKVWMLQYDDGNHGVSGKSAVDYTIRLTQFFDHYLKDKPAPIWMTKGIDYGLKGYETGFDIDMSRK